MVAILESAKGSLEALLKLPILMLIPLAMIVVGIVLKRSTFPNRFIPLVIVPLAAVLTCFVLPFEPGTMSPYLTHPGAAHCIRCASIGLVLGFLAWGTHRPFTKVMEKYVPGFDTSDTKFIDKLP